MKAKLAFISVLGFFFVSHDASAQYRFGFSSQPRYVAQPRIYGPMAGSTPQILPRNYWIQQQGRAYVGARTIYQGYQQIQRNPYVNSGQLGWNGVQCAGGALAIVGTDGAGFPIYGRTAYSCGQAGMAAWRYGQALGR